MAYASDWRDFVAWCADHEQIDLPAAPATVAAYLGALASAGTKVSTVRRRCAAIGDVHRRAGHDNPAAHAGVKATLAGIARTLGSAPTKKTALTADLLAKALRKVPEDLAGLRDRALILIGFAAALRRSELVALDVADIARHPKGLAVTVRRSKTDQAGVGYTKAIPHGRKLGAVRMARRRRHHRGRGVSWRARHAGARPAAVSAPGRPDRAEARRRRRTRSDAVRRALAALRIYFERRRSRGFSAGDRGSCCA
jgi:integrase